MADLYVRSGNRVPIHWEPENEQAGKDAVETVVGTVETYPVKVDSETAYAIRSEYKRLREKSGGTA